MNESKNNLFDSDKLPNKDNLLKNWINKIKLLIEKTKTKTFQYKEYKNLLKLKPDFKKTKNSNSNNFNKNENVIKKAPLLKFYNDDFKNNLKLTLSKISGAFLLPISAMAIAGLFLGIGALIAGQSPSSAVFAIKFGEFIKNIGMSVFHALPLLFAVAFVISFTNDVGSAVFACIIAYIAFLFVQNTLIFTRVVTKDSPELSGVKTGIKSIISYLNEILGSKLLNDVGGFLGKFSNPISTLQKSAAELKTNNETVLKELSQINTKSWTEFDILFHKNVTPTLIGDSLGVRSLNTSVFGGIIVGFVVSKIYNKYHNLQLPTMLSFFAGKRSVPLISMMAIVPVSFLFLIFWPWIGAGLSKFGEISNQAPYSLNAFIFGWTKRMLVPFGLHHAYYSPLWWTPVGGDVPTQLAKFLEKNELHESSRNIIQEWAGEKWAGDSFIGQSVTGLTYDTVSFKAKTVAAAGVVNTNATVASQSLATLSSSAGTGNSFAGYTTLPVYKFINDKLGIRAAQYGQGEFAHMHFGLPAAAAAMVFAAPKENRKVAMASVVPSAITSIVTGVTEPIEFTFLFLAPGLFWGFHAFMCGISYWMMAFFGAHVGSSFSGGIIEFIIYGIVPVNKGTQFWVWGLGLFFIPIYFFVFYFWIKWKDLSTPGRGGSTKLHTKADYQARKKSSSTKAIAEEEKISMIVELLGGKENILKTNYCASRLRYDIKNKSLVNEEELKGLGCGIVGFSWLGNNHVQIIVGPQAAQMNSSIEKQISI